MPSRRSTVRLPEADMQAEGFGRTRSDHRNEIAEDYVELIADLIDATGEAQAVDLANRLGVRQRSLYFALVTHALNGEGPDKHMSKRVIGAAYTMLDGKRHEIDDDFFRVRALQAKFKVLDDFVDYARMIDDTIGNIEQQDLTKFQGMMLGMFSMLRRLNSLTKKLPGKRFWRFNGGMHIVLTLVPPHRTYGPMTHGMMEPIYCGAWHPAANICTFCPGREYVTLNFSMETRHIANVDRITALLDKVEAMDIAPSGRKVVEDEGV